MSAARVLADLHKLLLTVEKLAYVPRATARIAAPKLTDLIRRQFAQGLDPYGRQWRALKPATIAKGRRPPPLTDSGKLAGGTGAKVGPAGITLTVGAKYGVFHQTGTRNMAARRILPAFGLPAAWRKVLDDAAKQAIQGARR
jgi:phage gpG-like protein